jgi:hypothetical protein
VTGQVPPPPVIPGFEPVETLRAGGFAVVYRYRQGTTERDVAVKVLNARLSEEGAGQRFLTEARLMARLSSHPHIVTIHLADVTADDRPYLVMEFCSGLDLAHRVAQRPMSVADVLRIGIRLSGAVETAHRAGILHRDIKPANVLVTDYGAPALTDFGISVTLEGAGAAQGLSVPWSPREVLEDPNRTSPASDVYSLAATLWHLLVGRSPFAVPGGPNGYADLVHRISTAPAPRTGREDVPAGLERVLAGALAKDPAERPPTALALARSLQAVERAAGYGETSVDIPEAWAGGPAAGDPARPAGDADAPGTRIRPVVTVDPDAGPTAVPGPHAGVAVISAVPGSGAGPASWPVEDRTEDRGQVPAPVSDTQLRPRASAEPAPPPSAGAPRPTGRRWVWLGAAAAVVAGGVTAAVVAGAGSAAPSPSPSPTPVAGPPDDPAVTAVVPTPEHLAGSRGADGSVTFVWQTPAPADGDSWVVRRTDPGADPTPELVTAQSFRVTGLPAGQKACRTVAVRRADGHTSATPATGCAG